MKKDLELMPVEIIENKIFLIRGIKVMLDNDLARLYGVTTKALNQAVKRNIKRFPADFMFELNEREFKNLRSQIVTSSLNYGGRRYLPYAFTEHGVTMLSAVLKSKKAVEISLYVVRAFIHLRQMLESHRNLVKEFEKMKKEQKNQNQKINSVINVINQMLNPPIDENKEPIGFRERKN